MGTLAKLGGVRSGVQFAPEAAATAARQGGIRIVARSPRQHGEGRVPQGLSIIQKTGELPMGVERICVHWDSGSPSPGKVCMVVEEGALLRAWMRSSSDGYSVGKL